MKREPVNSTDLAEVGYEEDTQTLEIKFNSGGVYQYYDVPNEEHEGLMNAVSHGKYFHANIKGVYRYKRVE